MAKSRRYIKNIFPIAGLEWKNAENSNIDDAGIVLSLNKTRTASDRSQINNTQFLMTSREFLKAVLSKGYLYAGLYDGVDTRDIILNLNPQLYQDQVWWSSDTKEEFRTIESPILGWQWQVFWHPRYNTLSDSWTMPTTLDGNSLDLGQEIFVSVENISGQDVTALDPKAFAVSGASVIDPRIKEAVLALAPDLNSGIRYGLNTTDALNGGVAKIAVFGTINDVNTSAWAEGDILFVSDTTPGELVNVRPAENAFVIGMVLFSDPVHGSIEVYSGRSELIDRTTPVGLDVTWMTGDPDTEPGFYKAMRSDRGTIAELIMDVVTGDNDIAPLPHDHLSIIATTDTTIKAGEARGHLEISVNRTAAVKRYWIEIYLADNAGNPIDAGTGLPNGDLGVPPIAVLVSGLVDPPTNTNSDISLNGVVESQVIVPINNRVRYHILCEKVGSQGGNVTHSVYFGTDHVCYIGVPRTISIGAAGNHGNVQFNQNGMIAGSDSLYWDLANNRLGIGTSTPSQQLHVIGTAFISGNLNAVGGRFQVLSVSSLPVMRMESAPGVLSHVFDANGDSYILNNNFGIGTDTPADKLTIGETNTTAFSIKGASTKWVEAGNIVGVGGFLRLYRDAGDLIGVSLTGTGDSYLLGGNVGIGIDAPVAKFHVVSGDGVNALVDGNGANAGNIETFQGNICHLMNRNTSDYGSGSSIAFGSSNTQELTYAAIEGIYTSYVSGSHGGDLRLLTKSAGDLALIERLRITHVGKVGIGTNIPDGKLHIIQSENSLTGGLVVEGSALSTRIWGGANNSVIESVGGGIALRTGGADRFIITGTGNISAETGFTARGSAIFEASFKISQHNETQYNKFVNIYNNAGTSVLLLENADPGPDTAFSMQFKNGSGDTTNIGLYGKTGDITLVGDLSAGGTLSAAALPAGSGTDFLVAVDAAGALKKSTRTEDTPGPVGPEGPVGPAGADAAWLNAGTRITLSGDPNYDIFFREDTFGRVYYAGAIKNTSGSEYTNNTAITGIPGPAGGSNNGFYPINGFRFPTGGPLGATERSSAYLYLDGSELRIQFDAVPDQRIESFGGSYVSINGD